MTDFRPLCPPIDRAGLSLSIVAAMTSPDGNPSPILLDLRGLRCPLPVLHTRKALAGLAAGARLQVESTDPLSAIDIPHMLNGTGDVLEVHRRDGAVEVFVIRRGA